MTIINAASHGPAILAPAGSKQSFLAALAAGADAIYCGLKHFSARMEADNFGVGELASLTALARDQGTAVNIAMNVLVKPNDLTKAGHLLERVAALIRPNALIVQDLGLIPLARQAGFTGHIHLSTLANVSMASALPGIKRDLGISRVILPRELSIDEIKQAAAACPDGLDLEVFIQGALCFAVSGRCYWSSFLGGKSGLRGRCVQPCRRRFRQGSTERRFFSCLDLSLNVLARTLLPIERIRAWKIEGRKKGPHYVFHTIKAYQLIRDHGKDPAARKDAEDLLERALGRKGTNYRFLPQKPKIPIPTDDSTSSGLFIGRTSGERLRPVLKSRIPLQNGDLLRVGSEDDPWHGLVKVRTFHPKGKALPLEIRQVPSGAPVYLLDRRDPELKTALDRLDRELTRYLVPEPKPSTFSPKMPKVFSSKGKRPRILTVKRQLDGRIDVEGFGLWLSPSLLDKIPRGLWSKLWCWLPPVIWPDEEDKWQKLTDMALNVGATRFMLNAPWQKALFPESKALTLWAGPFCNLANALALDTLRSMGFSGAVVSPELERDDFLKLPAVSPLPLGLVVTAHWPLCVSRTLAEDFKTDTIFTSPKGEGAWAQHFGQNIWVYPNWRLDLSEHERELAQAGYSVLVHMEESPPRSVEMKNRPGVWNWGHGLL